MESRLRRLPAASRRPAATREWSDELAVTLCLLLIICGVALYAVPTDLPDPIPATAPQTEFSSERALGHVQAIAREPHPMGSPANAAAREYLVQELAALGLQPEIQTTTAINCCFDGFVAGTPHNVVARLPGRIAGKALLLVAHYDSVPTGPGASDDGAGVAAMLETLRAIRAGGTILRNDVIFLFTDGEEIGLLGARAFVDDHPWADNVGLVLNLEARGNTGVVRLFETGADNGWVVRQFARAVPDPVATSADVLGYKLSGSQTDLSVFLEGGWPGLNLAYTQGLAHYHSALDTPEELDERSLQHLGSTVLALARHFGNADLERPEAPDAIYFNLGNFVVHYPQNWAIPLMAGVVLIFVAVSAVGFRGGALTVRGTALGFLALLLAMIVVVLVTSVVWTLIRALHPGGQIWALQYNANLFWLGFASLAIAATTTLYNWLRQRIGLGDLALGALFWPLLFMIFVSLFLPAASYSLTWPLLSSLLGLAALFVLRAGPALRWQRFVVLALSAIPILLLFAPGLNGVTLPVGLLFPPMVIVFALVIVLLLGLLVPHLEALARPNPWAVPASTAALGLLLLLFGSLTAGFDARHPQPNDIFYALDATTGKAIWASGDEAPDAWTAQFLGTNPTKGSVAGYLPGESSALLFSEAPPVALPAADVTLLDTRIRGGVRTLRLRITAPVDATFFDLIVPDKSLVKGASVNGRPVPDGLSGNGASAPWSLRYWNPPADGVEVALDIDGAEAVTLAATVATRGLPSVPGTSSTPRPPEMMASNLQEERTLVSKSFTFAARP